MARNDSRTPARDDPQLNEPNRRASCHRSCAGASQSGLPFAPWTPDRSRSCCPPKRLRGARLNVRLPAHAHVRGGRALYPLIALSPSKARAAPRPESGADGFPPDVRRRAASSRLRRQHPCTLALIAEAHPSLRVRRLHRPLSPRAPLVKARSREVTTPRFCLNAIVSSEETQTTAPDDQQQPRPPPAGFVSDCERVRVTGGAAPRCQKTAT